MVQDNRELLVSCLNHEFSTTRLVIASEVHEEEEIEGLRLKGGLRTLGQYKRSYAQQDLVDLPLGESERQHYAAGLPLISVVTVVRNGAATIEHAIRSVVFQDYLNIEYLIIDGDSDDGTLDILNKYNHCIDLWFSEPDDNVYTAMNKAIKFAGGDWIYFLGSDDLLIADLAGIFCTRRDDHTLYYGDVYRTSRNRLYDGSFSAAKLTMRNICQQAILYPRAVFIKYNFSSKYPVWADWHLNIQCYLDQDFQLKYIHKLIAIYCDTGGYSDTRYDSAFIKDMPAIVKQGFSPSVYMLFLAYRTVDRFLPKSVMMAIQRLLGFR